mmetsp:Transcript_118195/g.328622  ORF Transcript_118195/g.328622 Transcript_118195/m.328622 type:complete len:350 (-) Transcript_118195:106-1155(-)
MSSADVEVPSPARGVEPGVGVAYKRRFGAEAGDAEGMEASPFPSGSPFRPKRIRGKAAWGWGAGAGASPAGGAGSSDGDDSVGAGGGAGAIGGLGSFGDAPAPWAAHTAGAGEAPDDAGAGGGAGHGGGGRGDADAGMFGGSDENASAKRSLNVLGLGDDEGSGGGASGGGRGHGALARAAFGTGRAFGAPLSGAEAEDAAPRYSAREVRAMEGKKAAEMGKLRAQLDILTVKRDRERAEHARRMAELEAQAHAAVDEARAEAAKLGRENGVLKRAVGLQEQRRKALQERCDAAEATSEELRAALARSEEALWRLRFTMVSAGGGVHGAGSSEFGFGGGFEPPPPPDVF